MIFHYFPPKKIMNFKIRKAANSSLTLAAQPSIDSASEGILLLLIHYPQ